MQLLWPRRRTLVGVVSALVLTGAVAAVLLPLRSHLDIATVALVLVVPVVVGVVVGGFVAGVAAIAAGFLLYDLLFIKPYGTLAVGRAENWLPLGVYVVVMLLTARVTSHLWRAEAAARSSEREAERLFELSELIIGDRRVGDLLPVIASMVQEAFDVEGVVLLLPGDEQLEVVAAAGRPLSEAELHQLTPGPGVPVSLAPDAAGPWSARPERVQALALTAGDRPIGLLGLAGLRLPPHGQRRLATFANHIALALERAQLREQAVRVGVLEEVDQLRRSLVGAVSHDLRSPLATIKASASALRGAADVNDADRDELLGLIEGQTDRLTRLVANLLDMSRIQSNALDLRPQVIDVVGLLDDAVNALGPDARELVRSDIPDDLPAVYADHVLVTEVLVNLLENALRFNPDGSVVHVGARPFGPRHDLSTVTVWVADRGPGVRREDRDHIFERSRRSGSGGRDGPVGGSGLGLEIARSFVEAHGTAIWLEEPAGGGARFCFSLPRARAEDLEPFPDELVAR